MYTIRITQRFHWILPQLVKWNSLTFKKMACELKGSAWVTSNIQKTKYVTQKSVCTEFECTKISKVKPVKWKKRFKTKQQNPKMYCKYVSLITLQHNAWLIPLLFVVVVVVYSFLPVTLLFLREGEKVQFGTLHYQPPIYTTECTKIHITNYTIKYIKIITKLNDSLNCFPAKVSSYSLIKEQKCNKRLDQ